jgi:hypothetical protein
MVSDPRTWKREHRIALVLAMELEAALGVAFGIHEPEGTYDWIWLPPWGGGLVDLSYWLQTAGWAAFGAVVGCVLVYIRQC